MRVSNIAIYASLSVVPLSQRSISAFSIHNVQKNNNYRIISLRAPSLLSQQKHVILYATTEESSSSSVTTSKLLDTNILSAIEKAYSESKQWAEDFDLVSESGAAFHALFSGIRTSAALGLKGSPFYVKGNDLKGVILDCDNENGPFSTYFTFTDLEKALEDDFLDANRGSTDNRQGWKVCIIVCLRLCL